MTVLSETAFPRDTALEDIDVSVPDLYPSGRHWDLFKRLRQEDPVHFCAESEFGPYWSITKFKDIVHVESHHQLFTNYRELVIGDQPKDFSAISFQHRDPPEHDVQRKAVAPALGPKRLAGLEDLIRQRAGQILDELPRNETFNLVDRLSVELTAQMLSTILDVPFEERHKLPYWSDVACATEALGNNDMDHEERKRVLGECLEYFAAMWRERAASDPRDDVISMMAHNPATRHFIDDPMEFIGNMFLFIVGGSDTTRNSISGGVLALNQFPDQYAKLRANPALVSSMVPEIIRWQTPIAHMRRNATQDTEVGGKLIRKGDKVVLWYVSGNRDEEEIDQPDAFIIDRPNPRHHVSFGFGVHRCLGNRLAEMQLRVVWEEILKRFDNIEVVGEPIRVRSNFNLGIRELPVRISA